MSRYMTRRREKLHIAARRQPLVSIPDASEETPPRRRGNSRPQERASSKEQRADQTVCSVCGKPQL